jgi:predicted nucleotidyltransferase
MHDAIIAKVAAALAPVRGIEALVLGGSRARGVAGPQSDYDLGLYYDPAEPIDVAGLRAAIVPLLDDAAETTITPIGEWGPWINGGAWLTIDGREVDFLYRDLARVRSVIDDCAEGRISMNYQVGHPHGFCSAIWMGEVATCVPIADKRGVIAALKHRTTPFPEPLRQTLIKRFHWEVGFAIDNAEIALKRQEQTHIAGCAYRALCCAAQVLFALNRRYLINEKGALAEAAGFPLTIAHLAEGVAAVWAALGAKDLATARDELRCIAANLDGLVAMGT